MSELENYLDSQGRITEWPSKRNKGKFQQLVLEYLASRFEVGIIYSEQEVNALLNQYHNFQDPALLRREMILPSVNRKDARLSSLLAPYYT